MIAMPPSSPEHDERVEAHAARIAREFEFERQLRPCKAPGDPNGAWFLGTPPDIIRAVSEYFCVTEEEMHSKSAKLHIARPRQVAMWFMRKHAGTTYMQIGQILGGRNHATVIHGIQTVQRKVRNGDRLLTRQIRDIERILQLPRKLITVNDGEKGT
jgi:chromosomal replication initiation ATPase DnaA